MPQLDTNPWLFLLLATWTLLKTFMIPNILKNDYPLLPNWKLMNKTYQTKKMLENGTKLF